MYKCILFTPNNISGNITVTISDHPNPQSLFAPDIFSNSPSTKLCKTEYF